MTERCCYFLQTHRDPEQVYRLVRTLRAGSPRSIVLVQHNFNAGALDWAPLAEMADVHLMRLPYRQVRGGFSYIAQPLLDAIAWLEREAGGDWDWLVTLSGQDYPVMPLADSERRLRESGCDAFLRYWDVRSPANPWRPERARHRYWYRYRHLPDSVVPWMPLLRQLVYLVPGLHLSRSYGPDLGVRALRTPWSASFRCYGGRTWMMLGRPAARYLLDYLRDHPGLVAYYQRTLVPDESIVQTVLANSGRFRLENDDLRFIDYSRAVKGSPRNLGADDLPELGSGRYAFARKFEWPTDRELLDRIDRELLS